MSSLPEFLAWFDGFSENIEGAPNAKQWERIKARIGKLSVPEVLSTLQPQPRTAPVVAQIMAAAAPDPAIAAKSMLDLREASRRNEVLSFLYIEGASPDLIERVEGGCDLPSGTAEAAAKMLMSAPPEKA